MASSYNGYTAAQIASMSMAEYNEWRKKTITWDSPITDLIKTKTVVTRSDSYAFYRAQFIRTGDYDYLEKMVEKVEPYEEDQ